MRPTQLEKRLGAAEAMVTELSVPYRPPRPDLGGRALALVCTNSELTALQLICDRDPDGGLTEADQLRVQSIVLRRPRGWSRARRASAIAIGAIGRRGHEHGHEL